jgi:lipopolysaccharide/colanic/teichoic acid biosynthesis glycosyltransferase
MTTMTNALRGMPSFSALSNFAMRPRDSLKPQIAEILAESVFWKLLYCEQKRAERCSRCFVLMLADIEAIVEADHTENTLREVVRALSQSSRETDVAGWYREGRVLGVMYTDYGEKSPPAFTRLTRARVTESLKRRLLPETVAQIPLTFHFLPGHWEKPSVDQPAHAKHHPDLLEKERNTKFFRLLKRVMDVAVSMVMLILFAPLFLAIALAIKLTSKGPVLFKQERVGQQGLRFPFLKFRSMKCGSNPRIHREYVQRFIAGEVAPGNTEDNPKAVYKIQDDPRVTRIGKFLRKTSLDELPQLINVLKGEMSLVGPRPPIPYEVAAYQSWHRRRMLVKPGITGLWQVDGRSRTTFDDMVRLDLRYARTWSPWLDFKILLRTPRAMFSGEGAY